MGWTGGLASWPIRKRLLLLLLILFLPAFGIIAASGVRARREEILKAQNHALFVAESLAAQQEHIAFATRMLLSTLANSREVQRLDATACNQLFREMHDRYPFYSIILAVTPDGNVFAASIPFAPGTNLADRKHVRDAIRTRDFSVGEYITGRVSNVGSLNYTFPVLDAHQNLITIMIAGFSLKDYTRFLAKVNLNPNDVMAIADWKGVRLYRIPETDTAAPGKSIPSDIFARISGNATQGLFERTGQDGIDRIYAFRQVRLDDKGGSPYLYMFSGLAKAPILERAARQLWASLVILGISACLAMALAWWIGNVVFVKPTNQLVAATQQFARGELRARTGLPHSSDELGRLAAAFDDMAALLEERSLEREKAEKALGAAYAEMEERVQERTLALSATNAALTRENAERQQAETALRTRTAQLEAVREVSVELTRELDLPRLLDLITRRAIELIGAATGTVRLWDEAQKLLVPMGWTGGPAARAGTIPLRLGEGVGGAVAERRVGLLVNDFRTSPYATPALLQAGHNTVLAEPLLYRDKLLGVISVDHGLSDRQFAPQDQETLRLFASQAAIAIENARLFLAEQQRREQLEAVRLVSAEIARELDLDRLLDMILRRAVQLAEGEAGAILLWDEETQTLSPRVRIEEFYSGMPKLPISLGEGVVGRVAATRQGLIVNDYRTWPGARAPILAHTDVVATLAEPLLYRDKLIGVINLVNTARKGGFTEQHGILLRLFAAQAAIAIENAQLYQDAQQALDDLKRAQAELVRSEQLRGLGQMAAGIAHDLNNTLATVLGQAELLRLRATQPEVQEGLALLETAAADGAAVVRRLQEFARPKGTSPLAPCDLAVIVREAIDLTRPRWQDEPQRRGATITVEAALDDLPLIQGSPPELREALTNLIFNATDAMPDGGSLSLQGSSTLETVTLTVTDTGSGMPPEVQEKLFEPFFTTKGVKGTGLGLAVAYGIMARHGGTITVASAPRQGTTFTLTFLRASAGALADAPAAAFPVLQAPLSLLVVDDEDLVRQTLTTLLRTAGYSVVEAADGASALAALATTHVDVALTDLGMPGMSGWELARRLKGQSPGLPVILLTGWQDQAPGDEADRRSVDAILGKPVRLAELSRVIQEIAVGGEDAQPS